MSVLKDWNSDKSWIFAAGVLFGTAGIKLLSTKEAKEAYVHLTAAGIRAKDYLWDKATVLRENAEDVYEQAKLLNEVREELEDEDIYEE